MTIRNFCMATILLSLVFRSGFGDEVFSDDFEMGTVNQGGILSEDAWAADFDASYMGDRLVTAENGITPFSGNQMFRFVGTAGLPGPATPESSDMGRLIDLSSVSDLVTSGNAIGTVSMYANRVSGDFETDSEFRMDFGAFAGSIDDFGNGGFNPLGGGALDFLSDDDPSTWEFFSYSFLIPADAGYLAVATGVNENVFADGEIDGHYIDNYSFTVTRAVPEPSAMILLGGLGMTLGFLRRRI